MKPRLVFDLWYKAPSVIFLCLAPTDSVTNHIPGYYLAPPSHTAPDPLLKLMMTQLMKLSRDLKLFRRAQILILMIINSEIHSVK